jgi:hypothetical protein
MFKRSVLALACLASFGFASLATPENADAGWRYRGGPRYSYYYGGPRYSYYRPYRSYYRSYYRPYYGGYYYGRPRYYSYPRYYYDDYYYPRGGISVSFGW